METKSPFQNPTATEKQYKKQLYKTLWTFRWITSLLNWHRRFTKTLSHNHLSLFLMKLCFRGIATTKYDYVSFYDKSEIAKKLQWCLNVCVQRLVMCHNYYIQLNTTLYKITSLHMWNTRHFTYIILFCLRNHIQILH